jgi:hypothetical protein
MLSEARRRELAARFDGCLCAACLRELSPQAFDRIPRGARPDADCGA